MDNLNPLAVLYDSNQAAIGSVTDPASVNRLAVNTFPSAGVAVSQPAIGSGTAAKTVFYWLTNSSASGNMLVNGATTAQTFFFTPKVATLSVYYVRIIMGGASFALSGASFGGAGTAGLLGTNNPAALTKGLVLSCTSGGVVTTLYTLMVNEDFFALNGGGQTSDTGAGIALVGTMYFNQSLVLNSTDQVAITVNDTMTGRNITSLRACFCGVRP